MSTAKAGKLNAETEHKGLSTIFHSSVNNNFHISINFPFSLHISSVPLPKKTIQDNISYEKNRRTRC